MMVKFSMWCLLILVLGACSTDEGKLARPYAFHKIDFPARNYVSLQTDCPFTFELADYARMLRPVGATNDCWITLDYPQLNAKIHLTYAPFDSKDGLGKLINDAHRMTYKHTVKASSIEEIPISMADKEVYGFYFKVGGNAASSSQFYITDSLNHFVRGALYFESAARADSLEPLIAYMRTDLEHLLETFRWK